MLTDPIKFYQYFQIAHEQLQMSQKGKKETKEKVEEEKKEEKQKEA